MAAAPPVPSTPDQEFCISPGKKHIMFVTHLHRDLQLPSGYIFPLFRAEYCWLQALVFIPQFVINPLCVQSHLFAEGREIIWHYNKLESHVNLSCITTHCASPMLSAGTPCAIILLLILCTPRLFPKFVWHTRKFHFYLSVPIFSFKGKGTERMWQGS